MRILSILGLVALAACNGGNDCTEDCDGTGSDQDACADCSDDTGTDPFAEKFATIKVTKATFLGASDNCDVIVDEAKAGEVGDAIEVEAEHTHSVGVGAIGTDGFITHTLTDAWAGDSAWAGVTVFTPEWDVKLDPEALDEREVTLSLYPFHANDWWTCLNDRNDSVGLDILEIDEDGNVYVPGGPGWMALSGITLTKEGYSEAGFTTVATLTFVTDHPDGDINEHCYASDPEGNLVSPPE